MTARHRFAYAEYERHYNYEQKGGPLKLNDLRFTAAEPARFRLPS